MEISINTPSGGFAAQTTPINPKKTTDPELPMQNQTHEPQTGDQTGTINTAAAKYQCPATTLRYQIKNQKLAAIQDHPGAPYILRFSDVERLLRDSPKIASVFHPKPSSSHEVEDTSSPAGPLEVPDRGEPHPVDQQPNNSDKPGVYPSDRSVGVIILDDMRDKCSKIPDDSETQSDPSAEIGPKGTGTKRRRRRRRGKGGGGKPLAAEVHSLALKALTGTTPQERLRITACLNELAGLVASV